MWWSCRGAGVTIRVVVGIVCAMNAVDATLSPIVPPAITGLALAWLLGAESETESEVE